MLTGQPPWAGLEQLQLVFQVYNKRQPEYDLPDDLNDSIKEFITQTLTLDYEKRPTATHLLNHKLFQDLFI